MFHFGFIVTVLAVTVATWSCMLSLKTAYLFYPCVPLRVGDDKSVITDVVATGVGVTSATYSCWCCHHCVCGWPTYSGHIKLYLCNHSPTHDKFKYN